MCKVFQVALQVGFLKHLGDVATVLQDFVCTEQFFYVIPDRLDDDDEIRSLCGALVVVRLDTLFLFNSKHKHFLRCTYALICTKTTYPHGADDTEKHNPFTFSGYSPKLH